MESFASKNVVEDIVRGCFSTPHTEVSRWAWSQYRWFAARFPNTLAVQLLKVYIRDETNLKSKAIQLLAFALSTSSISLSLFALQDLKVLLLACLRESLERAESDREADMFFLSAIVRSVASRVFETNQTWMELADCIRKLANSEPLVGFVVFLSVPINLLTSEFLECFYKELLEEAKKSMSFSDYRGTLEVVSAFNTMLFTGLLLPENDFEFSRDLPEWISSTARDLLTKNMEDDLEEGVQRFESLLAYNSQKHVYDKRQRSFVFQTFRGLLRCGLRISVQLTLLNILEVWF